MNSSLYILLVKVFAPMAVMGAIASVGLYAWEQSEARAWDEIDVRWRRQLARGRRQLKRTDT